jgi:hypothetical protein
MSKTDSQITLSEQLTYFSEGLQIPPLLKKSLALHVSVQDAGSSSRCSERGCSLPSSLRRLECLTAAKAISIEHDLRRSKKFTYPQLGIVLYPFVPDWSQARGCFSLNRSTRPLFSELMATDLTTYEVIVVSIATAAIMTFVTPGITAGGRRGQLDCRGLWCLRVLPQTGKVNDFFAPKRDETTHQVHPQAVVECHRCRQRPLRQLQQPLIGKKHPVTHQK